MAVWGKQQPVVPQHRTVTTPHLARPRSRGTHRATWSTAYAEMPNTLKASATNLALLGDTKTKLIIQLCVASEYIYILLQSLSAYEYWTLEVDALLLLRNRITGTLVCLSPT